MNNKLIIAIAALVFVLGAALVAASEAISVGVKQGDWIEYQVSFTGAPDPGHDVIWARMEVSDVQGISISLAVATKFSNETMLNETITLNLETGQLGDDFIIPANLDSGDVFFDIRQGNITVSGVEERSYAGATRTILTATAAQTTYYWDRATGILVEAFSTFTDFTMHTKVDKTNMWQPQTSALDPTLLIALVIGVAVILLAVIAFFAMRKKK